MFYENTYNIVQNLLQPQVLTTVIIFWLKWS